MNADSTDRPTDTAVVPAVGENCCNSCHNGIISEQSSEMARQIAAELAKGLPRT